MKNEYLEIIKDKDLIRFYFYCKACNEIHGINNTWAVEINAFGKPTVNPSILIEKENYKCHMHIKNGKIKYLDDSTHYLAGKTVDMTRKGDLNDIHNG